MPPFLHERVQCAALPEKSPALLWGDAPGLMSIGAR
ncbi:UNVERIFIED_ORG: hypothetical protein GGD58_004005 [Rhizobium pisi]